MNMPRRWWWRVLLTLVGTLACINKARTEATFYGLDDLPPLGIAPPFASGYPRLRATPPTQTTTTRPAHLPPWLDVNTTTGEAAINLEVKLTSSGTAVWLALAPASDVGAPTLTQVTNDEPAAGATWYRRGTLALSANEQATLRVDGVPRNMAAAVWIASLPAKWTYGRDVPSNASLAVAVAPYADVFPPVAVSLSLTRIATTAMDDRRCTVHLRRVEDGLGGEITQHAYRERAK